MLFMTLKRHGPTTQDNQGELNVSWGMRLSNTHQTTNFDCTNFVREVLTVHGNELCLIWAKALPLL